MKLANCASRRRPADGAELQEITADDRLTEAQAAFAVSAPSA
jgi:hypothetical protein